MWDKIPAEWAVAFVTGIVAFVGNKLWNKASDKQKQLVESAIGEGRSVIRSLVDTAPPGTTTQQIEIWCKGAIAIQLAKRNIDPNNVIVKALVAEIVADGIALFIAQHPDKATLTAPIAPKLRPAA